MQVLKAACLIVLHDSLMVSVVLSVLTDCKYKEHITNRGLDETIMLVMSLQRNWQFFKIEF